MSCHRRSFNAWSREDFRASDEVLEGFIRQPSAPISTEAGPEKENSVHGFLRPSHAYQESVINLLKLISRLKRFASLQNPVRGPFAVSSTLSYSLLLAALEDERLLSAAIRNRSRAAHVD
jgi:hypothetical protein